MKDECKETIQECEGQFEEPTKKRDIKYKSKNMIDLSKFKYFGNFQDSKIKEFSSDEESE